MTKTKGTKIGCVVPIALLRSLESLAQAESISTGRSVSVSQLIRRALIRSYRYDEYSISVQRNSPTVEQAVNGLSRLAK